MPDVRCLAMAAVLSINFVFLGNAAAQSVSDSYLSDMDCVVEPSTVVELGSAVPGLLAETYYDRSDFVEAGTVMARLESGVERVSLAIAVQAASSPTSVDLRKLTAQFGDRTRARNAELLKSSSISEQVMDQVSTDAKIADLQVTQEVDSQRLASLEVERLRVLLNKRQIITPVSGSVTRRYKTAGEYVDSDSVYQISQLDPLHVEVIVPVDYLGRLTAGAKAGVTLQVPGFESKVLTAVVDRIDSVADAASATYGVRLRLDNPDLSIPSGVRCMIDFFAS